LDINFGCLFSIYLIFVMFSSGWWSFCIASTIPDRFYSDGCSKER